MAKYAYDPKSRGEWTPHIATDLGQMAGINADGGETADTLNRGFANEEIGQAPDKAWGGGTDPYGADIARYRHLGQPTQAPIALDQRNADESRGLQMGALGMMRAQADGSAPSSAGILANRANEDAVRNAGFASTSARSTGAGIVAARTAGEASARGALAANTHNADARMGEISRGQGAYASGAIGAQGQDTGAATANAQLVARQHALDESRQQGFERMAFDTKHAQMQNLGEANRQIRGNVSAQREIDAAAEQEARDAPRRAITRPIGMITGGMGSDERMKTHAKPLVMGSLASMMRRTDGSR